VGDIIFLSCPFVTIKKDCELCLSSLWRNTKLCLPLPGRHIVFVWPLVTKVCLCNSSYILAENSLKLWMFAYHHMENRMLFLAFWSDHSWLGIFYKNQRLYDSLKYKRKHFLSKPSLIYTFIACETTSCQDIWLLFNTFIAFQSTSCQDLTHCVVIYTQSQIKCQKENVFVNMMFT
jgi:hypothetical protein